MPCWKQDKVNGLRAGGDDYITKPFSLQELTARIEAHLRRDERKLSFSKREFDIIEFLSSNPNQVFDKERIYEAVWGYDAEGDSNVIKEHIRKIRAWNYFVRVVVLSQGTGAADLCPDGCHRTHSRPGFELPNQL